MPPSRRIPVSVGIDVGTTNTKVVAIDRYGVVMARAGRPTTRDATDLSVRAESVLDAVEDMVLEVCGDLLEVQALSVAGVGEDGVLVDAHLNPLTPALTWYDPRRREIFDALADHLHGDDTFDVEIDPVCSMVGWVWARRWEASDAAQGWVSLTDLAAARWARRPFLSDTLAPRTGAWRSRDRAWAVPRVEATLGDPALLPPVVAAGEVLGGVACDAFRDAGILAPDAVTVAGGHDHPIAAWGVRQMLPGAVLDSMGTAEVVVARDGSDAGHRRPHVDIAPAIRQSGVTLLHVEELARNVQWASREPEVADEIRALLVGSRAPLEVWEAGYFVRGARGGVAPAYAKDAPRDPRVRASAVLGALAVAGRDAVDVVSPGATERGVVRLAGGWVRSPGWLQVKAAVHGAGVAPILEPEVTAVGAAMLAAAGRGWDVDPVQAFGGFTAEMLR